MQVLCKGGTSSSRLYSAIKLKGMVYSVLDMTPNTLQRMSVATTSGKSPIRLVPMPNMK